MPSDVFGQFYKKWVSVRERNIKLLLETVTYITTTETVTCIITTEIVMCITGFPTGVKNMECGGLHRTLIGVGSSKFDGGAWGGFQGRKNILLLSLTQKNICNCNLIG